VWANMASETFAPDAEPPAGSIASPFRVQHSKATGHSHWQPLRLVHRTTAAFRTAGRHPDAANCPGRSDPAIRTPVWLTTADGPTSQTRALVARSVVSHRADYATSMLTAAQRRTLSSPALDVLRSEIRALDEYTGWRPPSRSSLAAVLVNQTPAYEPRRLDNGWSLPRPSAQDDQRERLAAERVMAAAMIAAAEEELFAHDGEQDVYDIHIRQSNVAQASTSAISPSPSRPSSAMLRSMASTGSLQLRDPNLRASSPSLRGRSVASPSLGEVRAWDAHHQEQWRVHTLPGPAPMYNIEHRGTVAFPGGYPRMPLRRGIHMHSR